MFSAHIVVGIVDGLNLMKKIEMGKYGAVEIMPTIIHMRALTDVVDILQESSNVKNDFIYCKNEGAILISKFKVILWNIKYSLYHSKLFGTLLSQNIYRKNEIKNHSESGDKIYSKNGFKTIIDKLSVLGNGYSDIGGNVLTVFFSILVFISLFLLNRFIIDATGYGVDTTFDLIAYYSMIIIGAISGMFAFFIHFRDNDGFVFALIVSIFWSIVFDLISVGILFVLFFIVFIFVSIVGWFVG